MKLLHLSDLHLGKRLYGVSMLHEQREMLDQILTAAEHVDAVLIAGDVYDKLIPPTEAVRLFDWFLTELAARQIPVLLISGNHDSAERLAFGAALFERGGVHLSPVYDGSVQRVTLRDAYGDVDFYLLPFLKPALVRPYHPEVTDYPSAIAAALAGLPLEPSCRNVLLAHQFVAGCAPSESEERMVGGLDEIPAQLFSAFDYVALGHLHQAQAAGAAHIRYCGSPLQYSFSEAAKTLTLVELGQKGTISIREQPLTSGHPLRTLRGKFEKLMAEDATEDYLRVILTDELELPDAAARLRSLYPNLLRMEYDNTRTRSQQTLELHTAAEELSPAEIVDGFYRLQNGRAMDGEQAAYLNRLLEEWT